MGDIEDKKKPGKCFLVTRDQLYRNRDCLLFVGDKKASISDIANIYNKSNKSFRKALVIGGVAVGVSLFPMIDLDDAIDIVHNGVNIGGYSLFNNSLVYAKSPYKVYNVKIARQFSEGLAAVIIGNVHSFMDKKGNIVIELDPEIYASFFFHENMCVIKRDDKYGFINRLGDIVIEPQFDDVNAFFPNVVGFSEGLAGVKLGKKWGFIDKKGYWVVPPQFDDIFPFSEGLAAVKSSRHGGDWGYIDRTGKFVIEPKYSQAYSFSEELALTRTGYKHYIYIDKTGKPVITKVDGIKYFDSVIPPLDYGDPQETLMLEIEDAHSFDDGLAAVKIGDKWGYINKDGKFVIEPKFDETWISEDMVEFVIDDKYGIADKTGEIVLEPTYDLIASYSEGRAMIELNDKYGFIDKNGNIVVEPIYDRSSYFYSEGLVELYNEDEWGYIDRDGNFVIKLSREKSAPRDYPPMINPCSSCTNCTNCTNSCTSSCLACTDTCTSTCIICTSCTGCTGGCNMCISCTGICIAGCTGCTSCTSCTSYCTLGTW